MPSLAMLDGRGQRRFDLFRIAAPMLAVFCAVFAVKSAAPAVQLKYLGLALMMAAMSVYVFKLRGLPIAQRPPVVFTPLVFILAAVFCFGTILCGMGGGGMFGMAVMIVPTVQSILTAIWLNSTKGRAYREALANRPC